MVNITERQGAAAIVYCHSAEWKTEKERRDHGLFGQVEFQGELRAGLSASWGEAEHIVSICINLHSQPSLSPVQLYISVPVAVQLIEQLTTAIDRYPAWLQDEKDRYEGKAT